jgi:hypothetical protein
VSVADDDGAALGGVKVRVARPASRMAPSGPNTILAMLASQANRRAHSPLLVEPKP